MTRNILVREITKENWEEAFKISVHENQGSFVPTVAESLAYAYLKPLLILLSLLILYGLYRWLHYFN